MITGSLIADSLLFLILGSLLFRIYSLKKVNRFFLFDPLMFFWVGALVIYVLEGFSNYKFYVSWFGEDTVLKVLLSVLIGIQFLHLGYRLPIGRWLANRLPEPPAHLNPNMLFVLSLGLICVGLFGWYMQIMTAGSFAAWAAVPRGGEDWAQLSGYVTLMANFLTVGISIFVLHVEMHKRRIFLKFLAWSLLLLLLLFFLYLGSRSRTIATIVIGLMAWSLPRRKSPSFIFLLPLFLGLYLVTAFQAEYRGNFKNLSFNLDQIEFSEVPSKIFPSFLTGDESQKSVSPGSEFGMTAAVIQVVPEQVPYNFGYEFLQLFTHPIPRSVWPNKPFPRGEVWSDIHAVAGTSTYWVEFVARPFLAGPSPGYIASWLYIGGLIGLLVGGIITGALLRMLRGIYDRSSANEGFVVLYMVLAPIGFGEATGHPFSWIYALPLILIPILIILRIVKRRIKLKPRSSFRQ